MVKFEIYDGVIIKKDDHGNITETGVNSSLAIKEEKDPRKCFLVAQLHIEHYCDEIILGYFSNKEIQKRNSLEKFLKSKFMSFNDKIELLKLFKNKDGTNSVDKKIINSLIVISEIRNAFQHNLGREDAMNALSKNRRKLNVDNEEKKLSSYSDSSKLMDDFKKFFEKFYPQLIVLWIRVSFNDKEQKKFLKDILDMYKKFDSKRKELKGK